MLQALALIGLVVAAGISAAIGEEWRKLSDADLYEWLQDSVDRFRSDGFRNLLGMPDVEASGDTLNPNVDGKVWIYHLPGNRALWISRDHAAEPEEQSYWLKAQLVELREDGSRRFAWTVQNERKRKVKAHEIRERRLRELYREMNRMRREKGLPPLLPGSGIPPTDVPPSKTITPERPAKG